MFAPKFREEAILVPIILTSRFPLPKTGDLSDLRRTVVLRLKAHLLWSRAIALSRIRPRRLRPSLRLTPYFKGKLTAQTGPFLPHVLLDALSPAQLTTPAIRGGSEWSIARSMVMLPARLLRPPMTAYLTRPDRVMGRLPGTTFTFMSMLWISIAECDNSGPCRERHVIRQPTVFLKSPTLVLRLS